MTRTALLLALLLSACTPGTANDAGPSSDVSTDASPDTATDVSTDASPDTATDAAAFDTSTDSSMPPLPNLDASADAG